MRIDALHVLVTAQPKIETIVADAQPGLTSIASWARNRIGAPHAAPVVSAPSCPLATLCADEGDHVLVEPSCLGAGGEERREHVIGALCVDRRASSAQAWHALDERRQ